jgi:hypothetical protein
MRYIVAGLIEGFIGMESSIGQKPDPHGLLTADWCAGQRAVATEFGGTQTSNACSVDG